MGLEIPSSLADVRTVVLAITDHVRPTATAEANNAVNMGVQKAVRAISSVRNQAFQSFVDPFTILANTAEYDLGLYDPPVWRPHRLLVGQPTGNTRSILFRYRALTSPDFERAELSVSATFSALFYDILTGRLPGTAQAVTASTVAATSTVTVASATDFQSGTYVQIPGAGPTVTAPGATSSFPGTYLGVVVSKSGLVLTVAPALTASATGSTCTPLRRRVMRIAPTIPDSVSGRLFYQFHPPTLVADTDLLDPLIAEHRDMVVYYAAAHLLRSVNEADAQRWLEQAQEMRSEMLQSMDPLSGSNTESFGTDMDFGDW